MGTSHFRSSVVGKAGTETIKGFAEIACATLTATTVTIGGAVSITGAVTVASTLTANGKVNVAAEQYIKLGSHQYIFFGELQTGASIEAYAAAIDASVKGSMYLSNYATPAMWFFTADDTAATVAGI